MQLVLINNRIVAHGEGFIAMGGVVINTETGKKYEHATIAECSGCPSDIGVVGYEYHAGRFAPCAPFGKGTGNIAVYCDDCKTPRDSGIPIDTVYAMSSYMAFAGNVNANMVSAAFGKGNEDEITGVGKALAMYAWFKGTDKTEYPFINLQNMPTLNDMNYNVYDEMINDNYLTSLIRGNSYAVNKIGEVYSVNTAGGNGGYCSMGSTVKSTITFAVEDEDLKHPFRLSSTHYIDEKTGTYNVSFYTSVNGIRLFTNNNATSLNKNNGDVLYNWGDVGITEPGEYTLEAGATPTKTSGSATTTSTNAYYASASMLKARQSYSI